MSASLNFVKGERVIIEGKMSKGVKRHRPSKKRLKELISIHCGNIQSIAKSTGFKPFTIRNWLKEHPELKRKQETAAAHARLNAKLRPEHKARIQPIDAKRILSTYYHQIEKLSPKQLRQLELKEEIEQVNNIVLFEGMPLQRYRSSTNASDGTGPSTGVPLSKALSWEDVRNIVQKLRSEKAYSYTGWHDYVLRIWCGALEPINDPESKHEYANRPAPWFKHTLESVRLLLKSIEPYL